MSANINMNELLEIQNQIEVRNNRIQAMKRKPFKNRATIKKIKKEIQALGEGQRNILSNTFAATKGAGGDNNINKNNYKTYIQKVQGSYSMYNSSCDYGGELFTGIVDLRKAFIVGEGISFNCKNKKKTKFLEEFIKINKLNGSTTLSAALMGELEGQILFTLATKEIKKEKKVIVRLFSWYKNKYKVKYNDVDNFAIDSITYKIKDDTKDVNINLDNCVYIDLYSVLPGVQEPHPKCGKVLTQIENISRGAYDLRDNTHKYGKNSLFFETLNDVDAKAIRNALAASNFSIGKGFAGTAKGYYVEPSGSAGKTIIDDILTNMKFVSSTTGIPVHWLSWPELMSNRATADNLLEVISAATKHERLKLIEGIKDLFEKACIIGSDVLGIPGIIEGEIEVKLPLISMAALQQLIDVFVPMWQEKLISKFDIQNMIPGIDPEKTNKQIQREEEEERENNKKDSTFENETVNNILKNMQNNDNNINQNKGDVNNGDK